MADMELFGPPRLEGKRVSQERVEALQGQIRKIERAIGKLQERRDENLRKWRAHEKNLSRPDREALKARNKRIHVELMLKEAYLGLLQEHVDSLR